MSGCSVCGNEPFHFWDAETSVFVFDLWRECARIISRRRQIFCRTTFVFLVSAVPPARARLPFLQASLAAQRLFLLPSVWVLSACLLFPLPPVFLPRRAHPPIR